MVARLFWTVKESYFVQSKFILNISKLGVEVKRDLTTISEINRQIATGGKAVLLWIVNSSN